MVEIKKVIIDEHGKIVNVGVLEFMESGWTVEEREMEYTLECGWREVGYAQPPTQTELLKEELTNTNAMLLDMMELLIGGI